MERKDLPEFADDGERLHYLLLAFKKEKAYALYQARMAKAEGNVAQYNYWRGVYSCACGAYEHMLLIDVPVVIKKSAGARWKTLLGYAIDFAKEIAIGTISDAIRG
jgi:hypothetical protein